MAAIHILERNQYVSARHKKYRLECVLYVDIMVLGENGRVVRVAWPISYIKRMSTIAEGGKSGGEITSNSSVKNDVMGSSVKSEILSIIYRATVNRLIRYVIQEPT